jgi:hypothetical protein
LLLSPALPAGIFLFPGKKPEMEQITQIARVGNFVCGGGVALVMLSMFAVYALARKYQQVDFERPAKRDQVQVIYTLTEAEPKEAPEAEEYDAALLRRIHAELWVLGNGQ